MQGPINTWVELKMHLEFWFGVDCAGADSWSSLLSISGGDWSLVPVAWGHWRKGLSPKGQAVSGTRRGQGYGGTVWTWQGLHFICNHPLTSSYKSMSLVWQWRAWSAGSPCVTGVRRRLCKVANCGLEPKKWKCITLVSLWNRAVSLYLVCTLLNQMNCLEQADELDGADALKLGFLLFW